MTISALGNMTQDKQTFSTSIEIQSEPAEGKQVIAQLLDKLAEFNWAENDVFGVHLAVEEAVVNAIKHGNQNDRTKVVRVQYEISADRFRIIVTDQGEGFDPEDVPDPTDEEHLELPSGRGLMLMRSFMTHIAFNDRGNQVTMEKDCTGTK